MKSERYLTKEEKNPPKKWSTKEKTLILFEQWNIFGGQLPVKDGIIYDGCIIGLRGKS